MRTIYFLLFATLFNSCVQENRETSKTKATNIMALLSIDKVDKIIYISAPPLPIRGEYEKQTPLFIDSVTNKWTEDKNQKKLFLNDFPEIILDSFQVIETSCCTQYYEFLIVNGNKSYLISFDMLNQNMMHLNGKHYVLKTNTLSNLKKYLNRTVVAKEEIISKVADTTNMNDINVILSSRGSIFIDSTEKETIIKYWLK